MNYDDINIEQHISVDQIFQNIKDKEDIKVANKLGINGGNINQISNKQSVTNKSQMSIIKDKSLMNNINSQSLSAGSKSKTPKLTPVNKFLNETFIYIRYNENPNGPSLTNGPIRMHRSQRIVTTVNKFIIDFLRHLNFILSARTNINYHPIDNRDLFFKIPIYVYTNEEAQMYPLDLILKRVDSIKQFISEYNFANDTKNTLWLIRTLNSLGVNFNTDFYITCDCDQFNYEKIDIPLEFNFPDIEYPKIKRHKLTDDSIVTLYEDPYFNDYGVFVNLAIPFNEMGMSYNGLHIYEHLMTKGWSDLSVNDQLMANGVTYPNGICLVYNILATEKAFIECANATFKFVFETRDHEFWQSKISNDALLETCRTISETRTERTLASMGRSDYKAYNNDYNREIFEYWSNKPFTILLTFPKGTKRFDPTTLEQLVREHPLRPIERPKNIQLKYYPLEVMMVKQNMKLYILKTTIEQIKKALMKPSMKTKMYFGVDCYLGQDKSEHEMDENENDLSYLNSVLHPLLYLNRYFTDDELKTFIKTHITAANSFTMANQPLCIRHAADLLDELELNL